MTVLSSLIERMIAAGVSPGEAGALAAEIYAAGVASATDSRSSGAVRQQRYRDRQSVTKRNDTVTERNDDQASQTVTKRNESVTRDASAVSPLYTKIKNSKRQNSERASRGTRIDPSWSPSSAEREFAKNEGLSDFEIDRDAARFLDYWKGRAGSGGVKLDWTATWQNWCRSTAEKLGKTPLRSASSTTDDGKYYAKAGSAERDAWDAYGMKKAGKSFPCDKDGGWRFPAQWPPNYVAPKIIDERPALSLRGMN